MLVAANDSCSWPDTGASPSSGTSPSNPSAPLDCAGRPSRCRPSSDATPAIVGSDSSTGFIMCPSRECSMHGSPPSSTPVSPLDALPHLITTARSPSPERAATPDHTAPAEDGTSGSPVGDGASPTDSPFLDVSAEGTEVVYVKQGVAVWPNKSQHITGRLSLLRQREVLFMTWLPYSHNSLNTEGLLEASGSQPPADRQDHAAYALHPLPLYDVKAVRRHMPAFGPHRVVFVLRSGLTLPPMYFQLGGVKQFLNTLKQHCGLLKSSQDPNTYLMTDAEGTLHAPLSTLELADVLGSGAGSDGEGGEPTGSNPPDGQPPWQGLSSQMLDNLLRVTRFARDTSSSFFASLDRPGVDDLAVGLMLLPLGLPPPPDSHTGVPGGEEAAHQARTDVGVFEILGSPGEGGGLGGSPLCGPRLSDSEFCAFFDREGRLTEAAHFSKRVFYNGLEPEVRREAWKYLLGAVPVNSTLAERTALMQKRHDEYHVLKTQWYTISEEQIQRFSKFKERRAQIDKDVRRTDRSQPFYASSSSGNLKLMRRMLLTYTMYNFDLGYCQGMSDLLSPILYVMRSEVEAFWCFVALMDRIGGNFDPDQRAVQLQLEGVRKLLQLLDPKLHAFLAAHQCLDYFCCFRWVLVQFKREVAFEDVMRLWEALWACSLTPHLHLYMCVAALMNRRREILSDPHFASCTLIKMCNDVGATMDLEQAMRDAEALVRHAGAAGTACLRDVPIAASWAR